MGRGAQHEAHFGANINSPGSVKIKMPDGHWFKGHPLCLAYYDSSIGTNVYIAKIQDSTAQIVGSDRVVFPDAFDGVNASVSYTFTRAGVSQDIRFHAKPPSPESFGLNPETTHLLAFTEVTESPQPNLRERSLQTGLETAHDQTIDFGAMRMIPGRAFRASNTGRKFEGVPVMKKWEKMDGRNFIIEDLRWDWIKSELEVLPIVQTNSVSAATNASIIRNERWYALKGLPPSPKASNRASRLSKQTASVAAPSDFVLDWELVSNTANSWYFGCYTTWLIDGYCNLTDVHFWSQAVVKYTPGSSLEIGNGGTFDWLGD
jgi:hypothetical protein